MNHAARTGIFLSSLLLTAGLIAPIGCDADPKPKTGGAGGTAAGGAGGTAAGGAGGTAAGGAGGTAAGGAGGAAAGGAGGTAAGGAGGGGTSGSAGAGGGATGLAGAGGGAGRGALGGAGGTAPFGAVGSAGDVFLACNSPGEYTANVTTIAYGGLNTTYTPACLKVAAGTAVTFSPASAGDNFTLHPLTASTYGTHPSPIITPTGTSASATFTFLTPGFYAFYCGVHGNDMGIGMAGVIWVE